MMPTSLREWFGNTETTACEKSLYIAILLTFFCLPLGTSPSLIAGGIAAAIWLLSGIAYRKRLLYAEKYWWPVYFLILLTWIGMLFTRDTTGLGLDYAGKTYYWLFGLAVAAIPFANHSPGKLIHAFMAGLGINAIVALGQIIFQLPNKNGWHRGLGPDYSTLSAYLIVGMMMGVYFIGRESRTRNKILFLLLSSLYFFHFALLQSRASYVSLILLTPLVGYTFFKRSKLMKTMAICLLIPSLLLLSPIVRERIALTIEQLKFHMYTDDESAWGKKYSVHQDRFYMWNGALKIIRENPLVGVGTGGYATVLKGMDSDPQAPLIAHPHNNFLYVAVSYGFLGMTIFIWFIFTTIVAGWRQRHIPQGYMLLSVILVMLTSGLFNTQILDVGTAFLISLTIGLQASFPANNQFSKSTEHTISPG